MCGRFGLSAPEGVAERFDAQPLPFETSPDLRIPRFNIAPSQNVVTVVRSGDGSRAMRSMRWGLVPFWSKQSLTGKGLINLKAESVLTQPGLRPFLERRRCIIPADGFYEWAKSGKARQPWHVALASGQIFGFAGLWEARKLDGAVQRSCAILTTEPNRLMSSIHDRMPVILQPDAESWWLNGSPGDLETLRECLQPCAGELLRAYPVSSQVNDVHNDGPQLRQRAQEPPPQMMQSSLGL